MMKKVKGGRSCTEAGEMGSGPAVPTLAPPMYALYESVAFAPPKSLSLAWFLSLDS